MHIGDCRVVTFIFNNKSVNSSIILRESNTPGPHPFRETEAVTNNRYLYNGKELEDYTIGSF